MADKKQISSRGIAQQSGLDVFSSVTTYNGEYLNWNYGNTGALTSTTDYATTAADPHTDALINSPASNIGRWYRYHTSGAPYTAATAPTSGLLFFSFNGQKTGGLPSYSGMYQKLSLVAGNTYQITVRKSNSTSVGSINVKVYTPNQVSGVNGYSELISGSYSSAVSYTSTSLFTAEFTAQTANDILLIYFTTDETSSVTVSTQAISIKEKQEYLVPIYATDNFGNNHKVLRRTTDEVTSDD
jgi:hypothetical protein